MRQARCGDDLDASSIRLKVRPGWVNLRSRARTRKDEAVRIKEASPLQRRTLLVLVFGKTGRVTQIYPRSSELPGDEERDSDLRPPKIGHKDLSHNEQWGDDQMGGRADVVHVNTVMLGVHWIGMPASLAMEQMQLISEEVFPAVRSAG